MSLAIKINNVLNSKATAITLFGATGVYKAYSDYKKAPYQEKDKVLLHDSLIFAGSTAGIMAFKYGDFSLLKNPIKKISNSFSEKVKQTKLFQNLKESSSKHIKKPVKILFKHAKDITKDCLEDGAMVSSGIMGAIGANYFIKLSHFNNKLLDEIKNIKNENDNNNNTDFLKNKNGIIEKSDIEKHFDSIVDKETKKTIIDSIPVLPELKFFNSSILGKQVFEVSEEKTFKDKLKHTTKCLISNSLVPLFFLSLSTNLTKGMKSLYRIPIIFSTVAAGTSITNKKLEPKLKMFDTEMQHEKIVY